MNMIVACTPCIPYGGKSNKYTLTMQMGLVLLLELAMVDWNLSHLSLADYSADWSRSSCWFSA